MKPGEYGMQSEQYREVFGLSLIEQPLRLLVYGNETHEKYAALSDSVTCFSPSEGVVMPFDDFSFDIAICPYSLFTENNTNLDFHLKVIRELSRVAKEVRIFPLINPQGILSPLLGPVLLGLQQENYGVEVRDVTSPLLQKENAMLRVWAQLCHVVA